jgi:uncharacterized protein (DUF2164 family)
LRGTSPRAGLESIRTTKYFRDNMTGRAAGHVAPTPRNKKTMTIEISKESRTEAIASIQRYFRENIEEKIGDLAADSLLGFFLDEIGPIIYNRAVADVQERLQSRVMEIDIEIHEEEFQYWRKADRKRKAK